MSDRFIVKENETTVSRIRLFFAPKIYKEVSYTIIDTTTGHEIFSSLVPDRDKNKVEELCKKANITSEAPEFRVFVDANEEYWVYRKTNDKFGEAQIVYQDSHGSCARDHNYITDKTCTNKPYGVAYYKREPEKAYKTLEEAEKAIEDIYEKRKFYDNAQKLECVK